MGLEAPTPSSGGGSPRLAMTAALEAELGRDRAAAKIGLIARLNPVGGVRALRSVESLSGTAISQRRSLLRTRTSSRCTGHQRGRLDRLSTLEQLAFERGEKALAHGIVEAITDRTHRGSHTGLPAAVLRRRSTCTVCLGRNDGSPRRAVAAPAPCSSIAGSKRLVVNEWLHGDDDEPAGSQAKPTEEAEERPQRREYARYRVGGGGGGIGSEPER